MTPVEARTVIDMAERVYALLDDAERACRRIRRACEALIRDAERDSGVQACRAAARADQDAERDFAVGCAARGRPCDAAGVPCVRPGECVLPPDAARAATTADLDEDHV